MKSVLLLLSIMMPAVAFADVREDPLTSTGLLDDVMSDVKNPVTFDWRNSNEYSLAYLHIDERNNFESSGMQFGLGIPFGNGFGLRTALRRIEVYQTDSSRKVGRTPFKQAAGVNRYEMMIGFSIALIEGRGITFLSPFFPDLSHSFQLVFGGHYAHANAGRVPQRNDRQEAFPGQDRMTNPYAAEAALRWQFFMPTGLGLFFEIGENFAIKSSKLPRWTNLNVGLSWSN